MQSLIRQTVLEHGSVSLGREPLCAEHAGVHRHHHFVLIIYWGRVESTKMCWLSAPDCTRRSNDCYLPSPLAVAAAFSTAVGLLQAMQHLMQRSMSAAFNSWRLVAQEMRQHGHNLVLAVTRWQHSYMSSAFYAWLDWIQERHYRYASLVSV